MLSFNPDHLPLSAANLKRSATKKLKTNTQHRLGTKRKVQLNSKSTLNVEFNLTTFCVGNSVAPPCLEIVTDRARLQTLQESVAHRAEIVTDRARLQTLQKLSCSTVLRDRDRQGEIADAAVRGRKLSCSTVLRDRDRQGEIADAPVRGRTFTGCIEEFFEIGFSVSTDVSNNPKNTVKADNYMIHEEPYIERSIKVQVTSKYHCPRIFLLMLTLYNDTKEHPVVASNVMKRRGGGNFIDTGWNVKLDQFFNTDE
ncbi:hypothetical protein J6590_009501 [Homalodisca vitripennis]|nr:hypothetical protein J6590_009501 [Homalodisca vitripennis]